MRNMECVNHSAHLHADAERRVEFRLGDGEQIRRLERQREFSRIITVVSRRDPRRRRRRQRRVASSRTAAADRSLRGRLGSVGWRRGGGRGGGRP